MTLIATNLAAASAAAAGLVVFAQLFWRVRYKADEVPFFFGLLVAVCFGVLVYNWAVLFGARAW